MSDNTWTRFNRNALTTAAGVADWIGNGARTCFATEGEVAPALFFVGAMGRGLMMHPGPRYPEGHPTDIFGDMIFRIGGMYPWRFVGCAVETWMRRETNPTAMSAAEMADLPRGALEAQALAGDPHVGTALLAFVLDLDHHDDSVVETSRVESMHPLSWDIQVMPGVQLGDLGETFIYAWEQRQVLPDGLPQPPVAMIAELVVASQLASSSMVVG